MKLYLLLICLVILYSMGHIEASNKCPGRPLKQMCNIRRDLGLNNYHWCKDKAMQQMWYYNMARHTCDRMFYLGCGGNHNRFCTKEECVHKCLPPK